MDFASSTRRPRGGRWRGPGLESASKSTQLRKHEEDGARDSRRGHVVDESRENEDNNLTRRTRGRGERCPEDEGHQQFTDEQVAGPTEEAPSKSSSTKNPPAKSSRGDGNEARAREGDLHRCPDGRSSQYCRVGNRGEDGAHVRKRTGSGENDGGRGDESPTGPPGEPRTLHRRNSKAAQQPGVGAPQASKAGRRMTGRTPTPSST